jgi:hypothetical protein
MIDSEACSEDGGTPESQGILRCTACGRELDYLTSLATDSPEDTIYICFESIKQRIFVYGKYLGGRYGAMRYSKYYTKDECAAKACEVDIKNLLVSMNREEYSRLITCKKGNMDSIILTRDIIDARKKDLLEGRLNGHFKSPDREKKYFCHEHAAAREFICQCGAELVQMGSEKHRDLTGMEDQKFIERFLTPVLSL